MVPFSSSLLHRRFLWFRCWWLGLVRFLGLDVRRVRRRGGRRCGNRWLDESRCGERHIHLDLLVCDLLFVLAAFGVRLVGVGLIPAGDFFVIAERGLVLALFAADHAFRVDLD